MLCALTAISQQQPYMHTASVYMYPCLYVELMFFHDTNLTVVGQINKDCNHYTATIIEAAR